MYFSSFNYLRITLRRKIEADNRWIYGEEDVTMTDAKKKKRRKGDFNFVVKKYYGSWHTSILKYSLVDGQKQNLSTRYSNSRNKLSGYITFAPVLPIKVLVFQRLPSPNRMSIPIANGRKYPFNSCLQPPS